MTRSRYLRAKWAIVATVLLTIFGVMPRGSAQAAIIFVTTTADELNGNGACSLKEAIYSADFDTNVIFTPSDPSELLVMYGCVPGDGDDTIILPSVAMFQMRYVVDQGNNPFGPTATPMITSNITIQAQGSRLEWLGTQHARAFSVASTGNLTIRYADIKGFQAMGGDGKCGGGGGMGAGGAIYVKGSGILTVENSTFEGNGAAGGNGGSYSITECSVGLAGGGGGGGLSGRGGKSGQGGGGGGGGARGHGGAGTSSGGGGGGTIINGGEASDITGGGAGGYECGGDGATASDDGSDGQDGQCPGGGGGGAGMALKSPTVGNSSANGGSGNYGGGGGGGTDNGGDGGDGGFGGGGGAASQSEPVDQTSGGNGGFGGGGGAGREFITGGPGHGGFFAGSGSTSAGGGGAGLGGAIFNQGGAVAIRNSTFTANYALRGVAGFAGHIGAAQAGNDAGGAIFSVGGSTTVQNSTISANEGTGSGGGILILEGTSFLLDNTIIANNGAHACEASAGAVGGHGNLIQDNDNCPGVVTSDDPALGPLQLNFPGKTPTMAISANSPAVGAAVEATSLRTDQRGVLRPQGTYSDIGAYERCPKSGQVLEFCDITGWILPDTVHLTTQASPAAGGTVGPP